MKPSRLVVAVGVVVVLLVSGVGGEGEERSVALGDTLVREGNHDRGTTRPDQRAGDPRPARDRVARVKPQVQAERKTLTTWYVARVIDGDTIELGNGAGVRVVGIDTPEVGECGYDAATVSMERLVLHRQVRLMVSDEDTDRYGRWLRYVDVGAVDAGLRQIKDGFAIARYDSRDGYGFHPREPAYIAADRGARNLACAKPAPAPAAPAPATGGTCAAGYSPCLPPYPPDVDCVDVSGPIRVTGSDPHGLDGDGDGVACE